ncbi:MAG: DUF11 domain-containing protein, partial [Firmicutes bacterium]|nr:DUF11 domain-containing protein [Bacillota bacterium]
ASDGGVYADTLPAHVSYVEGSASHGGVYGAGQIVWSLGALDAGQAVMLTFRVMVDEPLPAGVEWITNTAVVGDDGLNGPDPTPEDNADEDVDGVEAAPDLVVHKDDGETVVEAGQVLTYTVVVANVGDQGATGVVVTDTLPLHVTYVPGSASHGGVYDGTHLVWVLGDLGAGQVVTLTFRVTVDEPLPAGVEWITNTAVVGDDGLNGPDPTPWNNGDEDVDQVLAAPIIGATKRAALWTDADGDGNISPGDTLRYTVIIRNTGDREATNLAYADTPDENTTLVNGSVMTTQGVVTSGNAPGDLTVGVAIGSVWPGEVVTITYDVVIHVPFPEDISSVVNHGLITGDNVPPTPTDDPTTPEDRDPTIVPVNLAPEIIATKTAALYQDVDASGTTTPGDVLEYTVHITNVGTATAYGVVFQDLLDPNTTLVAGSVYASQGHVAVGNGPRDEYVIVEVGNLAPYGGAVEIRYRVYINSPLPPGVTIISNQGFISGSNVDSTVTDDPTTPEPDDPTDVVVSPPTYVGLLYIQASHLNARQVLIRWETAIEVDNL